MSRKAFRSYLQRKYGGPWRWKRAQRFARDRCLHTLGREDKGVRAIATLLLRNEFGENVDKLNPAWVVAFREAQACYQEPTRRLTLDALILAGEGALSIADQTGLDPLIVGEYERCFFNVYWLRQARDFILDYVINRSEDDDDVLRRVVLKGAYFGGPEVANLWLHNLDVIGRGIDHDLETPEGRDRERLELLLLSATVNLSELPERALVEISRQCRSVLPPPPIPELVRGQIERVIRQLPVENLPGQTPCMLFEPFVRFDIVRKRA